MYWPRGVRRVAAAAVEKRVCESAAFDFESEPQSPNREFINFLAFVETRAGVARTCQ